MSLDQAMKNLKFDARMRDYNLNKGVLTEAELQKHLAQIPDSAANVTTIKWDEASTQSSSDDQLLNSH